MKYNTQNRKIADVTEKTLVVGVDVGSEFHYARAFDWRKVEYSRKAFRFSNSEKGFQEFSAWMEAIAKEHGKDNVRVGMEPTGHYWFNLGKYLQDSGIKLVLVNPYHVKNTKEMDDNNQGKNDRKDPKVIAGLIIEGRYMYPYIPEGLYAEIRTASNLRFQTQEELTRITNRISRWLSIYFPEFRNVYRKPDPVSGWMILRQAPLPEDIKILGEDGINKIWRDAKLRGAGKKRAATLFSAAEHSIGSKACPVSARMEIKNLIADYDRYKARMNELMNLIEGLIKQVPYAEKLLGIKGVGIKVVSAFVAEAGDVSRFTDPKQVQKLAGYAIVENSSGKHKGETTISRRGRKRLRYALYEAALSVIGKNDEFREIHHYYTTRGQNPLKKMQSLVAVACKLIRIFYVILTKGVDYDPEKMLKDIHRPVAQLQAA